MNRILKQQWNSVPCLSNTQNVDCQTKTHSRNTFLEFPSTEYFTELNLYILLWSVEYLIYHVINIESDKKKII